VEGDDGFATVLDESRACFSNNAAERALRGFAVGRRAWLFAGSHRGARRAAAMATLIAMAKHSNVDPQAGLADARACIAGLRRAASPNGCHGAGKRAAPASAKPPDGMAADANVVTIALAAQMLCETDDRLWALADQMDPEDGLVWIHATDERQTAAFRSVGIENLKDLIADQHTTES
jgi:hypothetical protein